MSGRRRPSGVEAPEDEVATPGEAERVGAMAETRRSMRAGPARSPEPVESESEGVGSGSKTRPGGPPPRALGVCRLDLGLETKRDMSGRYSE